MAISGRVARIATLYQRLIAPVLAEHGIEEWEYDVLATLRRSNQPEGLTMSDLTEHMLLAAGSTTHRVDRLVKRALVTRRQDPDSRRRVLVSLTAEGRSLIDRVLPRLSQALDVPVAALGQARRDEVTRAMRTLLLALEHALTEEPDIPPVEPRPRRARTKPK